MTAEDETFLNRWSRRKQAEPEEIREEDQAAEQEEGDAAAAAPVDPVNPEDLPDIDSLEKDSDFTVFMQQGVPDALRNRALRKLWLSDPVFANLDGLNDYDEDFGAILRAGAEEMKKIALEKAEKLKQEAKDKIVSQGEEEEEEQDGDKIVSQGEEEQDGDEKPAVSGETAEQTDPEPDTEIAGDDAAEQDETA